MRVEQVEHDESLLQENARLWAEVKQLRREHLELQRQADELRNAQAVLQHSVQRLTDADGPQVFLDHVLIEIACRTQADLAHLYRYDPIDRTLTLHLTYLNGRLRQGPSGEEIALLAQPVPVDITPGFELLCRQGGFATPTASPIPPEEFAWPGALDWLRRINASDATHSVLFVGEEPVGTLGLTFTHGKTMRQADQPFIAALAQQAALALKLTDLSEQAKQIAVAKEQEKAAIERVTELEQINEALRRGVERVAGDMGLDALLGSLLIEAMQVCGAAGGGITGWKQGQFERHHCIAQDGAIVPLEEREREPFYRETAEVLGRDAGGFASELLSAPVSVARVEDVWNWWPAAAEYHVRQGHVEVWNLPCVLRGELVAHLGLAFREPCPMDEKTVGTLTALAQQMTLALELTRLAEEAKQAAVVVAQEQAGQERAAELAKSNEALRRGVERLFADQSIDSLIGAFLAEAVSAVGARGGAIMLRVEGTRTTFRPAAVYEGRLLSMEEIAADPYLGRYVELSEQDPSHIFTCLAQGEMPSIAVDELRESFPVSYAYHTENGDQIIWHAPLRLSGNVLGFLGLALTTRRLPGEAVRETVEALAQQLVLALELTRLAEEAKHAAIFEERTRIAGEIHDTLAQSFTGIAVQLEAADVFLTTKPDVARGCLDRAIALAREGLTEARRSVWSLRPDASEYTDLNAVLVRALERATANMSLQSEARTVGTPRPVPPYIGYQMFRVAQEAITNTIRHSRAKALRITLHYEPQTLFMLIQDDGDGFDIAQAESESYGLAGMKARTLKLGGQIHIETQPGQGTRIAVRVPCSTEQETPLDTAI